MYIDETLYAVKVARTMQRWGKTGDCIKGLPIMRTHAIVAGEKKIILTMLNKIRYNIVNTLSIGVCRYITYDLLKGLYLWKN